LGRCCWFTRVTTVWQVPPDKHHMACTHHSDIGTYHGYHPDGLSSHHLTLWGPQLLFHLGCQAPLLFQNQKCCHPQLPLAQQLHTTLGITGAVDHDVVESRASCGDGNVIPGGKAWQQHSSSRSSSSKTNNAATSTASTGLTDIADGRFPDCPCQGSSAAQWWRGQH